MSSRGVEGMSRSENGLEKRFSYQAVRHVYDTCPGEAEFVLKLTGFYAHALHTQASAALYVTANASYVLLSPKSKATALLSIK